MYIRVIILITGFVASVSYAAKPKSCKVALGNVVDKAAMVESLEGFGASKVLASRLLESEPIIASHIADKAPFVSLDENFFDPNTLYIHNFKNEQQNPNSFKFKSFYRGLGAVNPEQLSKENIKEQNRAIWVSTSQSYASEYAANTHVRNISLNFGVIIEMKIPEFLIHWSGKEHGDIDFNKLSEQDIKNLRNDIDYSEQFLDRKSFNDWRNFIVRIGRAKSVVIFDPIFEMERKKVEIEWLSNDELSSIRQSWD